MSDLISSLFTRDVANVRHFVWMLVAGESIDILTAVGNKEFSTRRGDVASAMLCKNSKHLCVFAEPNQIAIGLREQALELRIVRKFFDDDFLAH